MESSDTSVPTANGNGSATDSAVIEPPTQTSQTANDYINTQLRLEADAREVLPFSFDHCTQPLGPLRQNLFSCLTCNPPPSSPSDPFTPAAVCYSCSIACHGEHTLVELFHRRNFVCDCGTTRLPETTPCTLRIDPKTGLKGPVHSEEAAVGNTYNHNARNRFCDCGEWYEADKEKGTMFQCLGLKTEIEGGCGEDWWHPECVIWGGVEGRRRRKEAEEKGEREKAENKDMADGEERHEENELPPGFPQEEDFETFICYKCIDAVPWLKQYAGTEGFLPAIAKREPEPETNGTSGHEQNVHKDDPAAEAEAINGSLNRETSKPVEPYNGRKRSADDADLDDSTTSKKAKAEPDTDSAIIGTSSSEAYHTKLPPAPTTSVSLFCKEDFRDHFCRCRDCYPRLSKFPQLLEEEDNYEPPLSENGENGGDTGGSVGSKSILERGEEALSNVDRVRAIGKSIPIPIPIPTPYPCACSKNDCPDRSLFSLG